METPYVSSRGTEKKAVENITGIIPIVRDKVQSKLNEFTEYTMIRPRQFAGMIGFTEEDVKELCEKYERVNELVEIILSSKIPLESYLV